MQGSKPITIRGEPIPAWFVDERGHRDERESWLSLVEKEGLRRHNSVMQSRFRNRHLKCERGLPPTS
ncbi:hypothetical protein KAM484_42860 [Aeromonas caviae]|nr:hypothetical protein KAM467_42840 [Aeromonas caviae]GKR52991.1 hypothetical protein KAM475_21380 [Aeromonas caviae]GKR93481.1 hypothetical protein KAM484_42860 [Aeromonas caviae]